MKSETMTRITDVAKNIGSLPPFLKKTKFSVYQVKLTEVYGVYHSLFHIEYNWNFAFDLQLDILFNTVKQMKMAWPKILVPLT